MDFKSISLAATALVLSTSVDAAIISTDWQISGDNLITTDTESGLNWLDLTETNGLTYDYVSSQLSVGGQFEGFRYATPDEVVALYYSFSINLAATAPQTSTSYDFGIMIAAGVLGNTTCAYDCIANPYGTLGYTSQTWDEHPSYKVVMGATVDQNSVPTYRTDGSYFQLSAYSTGYTGSYLVQAVPVPAAVWLFGSGLLGLIGVARRKVRA